MTDQGYGVVRPLPGNGVVAHAAGLLMVCDAADSVIGDLLAALRDAATSGGDGTALARRVAQVLARSMMGEPVACAVAGPSSGGIAVLVSGSASASVGGGPDGAVQLSGRDALTWTDRLVTGPVTKVELRLPGAGRPSPHARLERGVIAGAGLVCEYGPANAPMFPEPARDSGAADASYREQRPEPRPAPAADPGPAHPEPAYSDFSEPTYQDPGYQEPAPEPIAAAPEPPRPQPGPGLPPMPATGDQGPVPGLPGAPPGPYAPLPAEPQPAEPGPGRPYVGNLSNEPPADPGHPYDPAQQGQEGGQRPGQAAAPDSTEHIPEPEARPMVYGVDCSNDHFNDPRVPYCAVCGVALAQRSLVPYKGPRPQLGALLLDDGVTLPLDSDYLLGRDPERASEVLSGEARPAKVTSPDGSVSRRHVRVKLDGWDVNLIDLGSVNGTQVQPPGDPNFYDIPPNEQVTILPGTTVRIGVSRTMRFESHRTH